MNRMKLPLSSLGKLLRLAERCERERMENAKPLKETIAEMAREMRQKAEGTYEEQSEERNLLLFLETLGDEEKRDVIALFYLGRHAGDNFEELRSNPAIALEHMHHHLADKRDLESSLIEGIKRLAK